MINIENITQLRRRTLGLTIVLTAAAMAFGQEKQQISGKVLDSQKNPIPYASVTFKNKTVKENAALFSDATLTDDKGHYTLNLVPGSYEITIEAIDFKKTVITKNISGASSLENFTLENETTVTNTKTKDIEGVTLTAATKPYKIELDKRTYDVNQDIISKGGNLQDVLSNVPSISVDTDGTVSMRGSSNVKFLINGKPSALLGIDDGANALQSIPADQIDRIEVITNPSSKFEASGTAGILNIILKKDKKLGLNGSVTGTLGYLPQTNLNASLNLRKGNLTWFLNGGLGYRESKNTNRTNAYFTNPTTDSPTLEQHQESITESQGRNYNASTGFVYDFSDRTSVNASGTVRTFDNNSNGNVNYNYLYFDSTSLDRLRTTNGKNNNLAFQGDFGLDHKFDDKGQNIALSLSLQRNRSFNDTDIEQTSNNSFDLENIINQETINKSIIGKADYELPIGEKSKFEAGYRLDVNNNDYNNDVRQKLADDTAFGFLPKYTYDATYKEVFNAFYAQFKSKLGNLGYQIGLRNEYSNVNIDYLNQEGTAVNTTKNYNNLFPSVFLSYDLGKDNQLLVNYSKRIDRPRSFFMIPNPNYNDNQNIFDGNINLNPSYVDSYELGYSISKKKLTINPTLYYKHQKDDVKMVVYNRTELVNPKDDPNNPNYDPINANPNGEKQTVFHTMPVNLGSNDRYGLEINFNWDATKWLKFLGNIDFYGYKTKGSFSDPQYVSKSLPFDGSGFSTRARLTSTFKIDKTFNFQLQGFYRGAENTKSSDRKDMYAVNFGASKTVLKGSGTITFNIQDIFNTRTMRSTSYGDGFSRDSYMQWQPRQFALSFTYRFKQGEKIEQPKKKKDVNSNDQGGDDMPPM